MMPKMMTDETAAATMTPAPSPLRLDATTADARFRMREEDVTFLPVVARETDKLLGVVLRSALERACEANGHDPSECRVSLHLKADIDFCFVEDSLGEVLSVEPQLEPYDVRGARKARVRRSLPVIVVDQDKVPVGILER
ncbi:MAG: CBS domain-containing protein [Gemmatimonadota bacterium]